MICDNAEIVDITYFALTEKNFQNLEKMKFITKSIFFLLLVISNIASVHPMSLEEVKDDELAKLINQEQFVLVLFSKLTILHVIFDYTCKFETWNLFMIL